MLSNKPPDGASPAAMTGYNWMRHGLGRPMQASECGANCAMDPQPFSWGPATLFKRCSLRDTLRLQDGHRREESGWASGGFVVPGYDWRLERGSSQMERPYWPGCRPDVHRGVCGRILAR